MMQAWLSVVHNLVVPPLLECCKPYCSTVELSLTVHSSFSFFLCLLLIFLSLLSITLRSAWYLLLSQSSVYPVCVYIPMSGAVSNSGLGDCHSETHLTVCVSLRCQLPWYHIVIWQVRMPSILPVKKQLHRDMCCQAFCWACFGHYHWYCRTVKQWVWQLTYGINCIFSDQRKSICHVKLLLIREQFKLNLQLSICVTDWVCVDVSTR